MLENGLYFSLANMPEKELNFLFTNTPGKRSPFPPFRKCALKSANTKVGGGPIYRLPTFRMFPSEVQKQKLIGGHLNTFKF